MSKVSELLQVFQQAVERLDGALQQEKNEYMRDSAIQRFEFTFDLAWKTMKAVLEEEGVICSSPKSCLQASYRNGLVDYDTIWLEMLKLRNETTHTYNESMAEIVYAELPKYLTVFKDLSSRLQKEK